MVRDKGDNHRTRRQSGYISGSVFLQASSKIEIHFTRFPCLPPDITLWEIVSLSTLKVFDACYRFLSTHTHTHATISQQVSLSTVKPLLVIEGLQLCAPILDTISYAQEQGKVSLLTMKLPCTIEHT